MMKRVAVLTSGGDAPGMNACIRAVVRSGIYQGLQVVGIEHGYAGLYKSSPIPLELRSVANILQRGGTFLRTSRCPEFMKEPGRARFARTLQEHGIDGLIAIGGDGTLNGAQALHQEHGIPVVGVPASIDNDVPSTERAIGFDTAINSAVAAIDKIRDTAASHDRVFIVEVMGKNTGHIASYVGLAGGAEAIVVPETVFNIHDLIAKLESSDQKGKSSSLIVAAEGQKPGRAYDLAENLRKKSGIQAKVCVLGHILRGGSPTAYDRVLASQMGSAAVNALVQGQTSGYIALQRNSFHHIGFESLNSVKELNISFLQLSEILSL